MARRPTIFECAACGRLWVFDATPAQVGAQLARLANGLTPCTGDAHVGGCIEGEPETWSTRCTGEPRQVRVWPEIEAAFRLGGVDAASACVRPRTIRCP